MAGLNYHHLELFYVTAREGSLSRAARRIGLAPSTISEQLRALEASLGQELFNREGRSLALTEAGSIVLDYANGIFALGFELSEAARVGDLRRQVIRLRVGVTGNLAKLFTYSMLEPALHLPDYPVHVILQQERVQRLLVELELGHLDLVIADRPLQSLHGARAESTLLGQTAVCVCGSPALAARMADGFPASLDGAPFVLPHADVHLRQHLERWFSEHRVFPRVVAELDDLALVKSFGGAGVGLVCLPQVIATELGVHDGLESIGTLDGVYERVYAVRMASGKPNRAIEAVLAQARDKLLAAGELVDGAKG